MLFSTLHSFSFAIILMEESAGCFTLTVPRCLVKVSVLWLFLVVTWALFLVVTWAGMQCVIVVYPDHSRFIS